MRNPKRQATGDGESAPYIPVELLLLIIARLPVKSILRFKCLSSLWNSIISDPQFEELQFHCSRPSLLISGYSHDNGFACFNKRFSQPSLVRLPLPIANKVQSFKPYSQSKSVGGLVLDYSKESSLRIYNPSTGELSGDISIPENVDGCMEFCISMFGYDPIDRTHKILGMWIQWIDELRVKTRYRVLTLDKQMKWRSLDGGDSHEPIYSSMGSICLDGVIYCLGSSTASDNCFGGFDVKSEVLRWVRLPPAIATHSFSSDIIEFNGRVALYCSMYATNDAIILWLFEGFDEQRDPWRRITIAKPPQWKKKHMVEGTIPSGELLFWDSEFYGVSDSVFPITLFYYNIDSEITRTESVLPDAAETDTLYDEFPEASVTNHVESIKSLKYISN